MIRNILSHTYFKHLAVLFAIAGIAFMASASTAVSGISGIRDTPTAPPSPTQNEEINPAPTDNGYTDQTAGQLKLWFLDPSEQSGWAMITNPIKRISEAYGAGKSFNKNRNPLEELFKAISRSSRDPILLHQKALLMGGTEEDMRMDDVIKNDLKYASMALYKAGSIPLWKEIGWYNADTDHYGGIRAVRDMSSNDGLPCREFHWYTNFKGNEKRGLSVGCYYNTQWFSMFN